MFHARDGFYFERGIDGGVRVMVTQSVMAESPVFREINLTPSEWASVVASMSAEGEHYETWRNALSRQVPAVPA